MKTTAHYFTKEESKIIYLALQQYARKIKHNNNKDLPIISGLLCRLYVSVRDILYR